MTTDKQQLLRAIPKVDECLAWFAESPADQALEAAPLVLVKRAIREILEQRRNAILTQTLKGKDELSRPVLKTAVSARIQELTRPRFQRLINATGVVVHTNMGRSLLPEAALNNLAAVGGHYSNLEFDLNTGKRGSRYSLVEDILCDLTGAEAALVVNNNAAAVLLCLSVLAQGREVIVSRGQLVEIGGSFRIPDVMTRSGARLMEVGATNRTHLKDYETAIGPDTALLLKVHTSNYRLIGFTSEVSLPDLVKLGARHGLPVMEDLGSGSLMDMGIFGLPAEPTVGEILKGGVDVVTFSGDKLLGGPQAGLILGKKEIIAAIKSDALNRALRIDKFTLAALETVLRLYYDPEQARRQIPTLAMLGTPFAVTKQRAVRLRRRLGKRLTGLCRLSYLDTESRVGGGALPERGLPSRTLALEPTTMTLNKLETALRRLPLPVIGRIEHDKYILDLRTVSDKEIPQLTDSLLLVFNQHNYLA